MADKYKSLKVKELQEILQKHGLPHSGKKEELIDRLVKYDERKVLESLDDLAGLEEFDESKLDLDSFDPDMKMLPEDALKAAEDPSKVEQENAEPAAATTTATAPANTENKKETDSEAPKIVAKPGSNFIYTPISFSKSKSKETPEKTEAPKAPATKTEGHDLKNEVERKLERAKRFNMPLDEKTRKQLRGERFGQGKVSTPPAAKAPTSPIKGLDPEVLKKRAERFGLPLKSDELKSVEEEKKRKRAERFGVAADDNNNNKKKQRR